MSSIGKVPSVLGGKGEKKKGGFCVFFQKQKLQFCIYILFSNCVRILPYFVVGNTISLSFIIYFLFDFAVNCDCRLRIEDKNE